MAAPLATARPYEDRPLLDFLTDGNYSIRVYKLRTIIQNSEFTDRIKKIIAKDQNLSLASATDEKVYLLWIHDYPGWLEFTKPLGFEISEHPKLPKRLTTLTRQAGPHAIGDFTYASVQARSFMRGNDISQVYNYGFDPSVCLDGGNVISQELLSTMGSALGRNTRGSTAFFQAGSYAQVRAFTPDGLIKGDALVASRANMGGYDILYHPESICPEVKSQTCYVMAEPRSIARKAVHECLDAGSPPLLAPAWTDDQTMAWLGPWLWPKEHLDMSLQDVLDATLNKLAAGHPPEYVSKGQASGDSLSDSIIRRAQSFQKRGFGIKASVYLTESLGQGVIQHLTARAPQIRWPIPNAGHPAVATDCWLRMAGYPRSAWPTNAGYTEPGTVWLHPQTQRLVYNDADFAALYSRHGGWDLDDTVTAHWRRIDGKKAVVMYRQPNTYGEYSVASHPTGAFQPTWYSPTEGWIDWLDISSEGAPEYLENLDTVETNPQAFDKEPVRPGEGYTRHTAIAIFEDAIQSAGVLGSWVNVEMAYHATHLQPRPQRVAATESVVDACTQSPTETAIDAIQQDARDQRKALDNSQNVIDDIVWTQRISSNYPPQYATLGRTWWSHRVYTHDQTIAQARRRLFAIGQYARENIPSVLYELGRAYHRVGNQLVRYWFNNISLGSGSDRERFSRFDQYLSDCISQYGDFSVDVTLAVAANVYLTPRRRGWSDTLLFGPQMLTHYITAIEFYRLDDMDAKWQGLCFCNSCGQMLFSDSRVETQRARFNQVSCAKCVRVST